MKRVLKAAQVFPAPLAIAISELWWAVRSAKGAKGGRPAVATLKRCATPVAVVAFMLLTDVAQALRPANAGPEPRATTEEAQSGNDLFQQALSKERAEGKLEEAIQLYERIVKDFASDRTLAARTLLQLGRCYDKLGKVEARRTYERLVREYADQRVFADEARARLAALDAPRAATTAGGIVTRQVTSAIGVFGTPSPDGRYLSGTDWTTGDLVIQDLTTKDLRRLTQKGSWAKSSAFAMSSMISPDSGQVAYVWFEPATEPQSLGFDLRIAARDGSRSRVLYHHVETGFLWPTDWSPDGRQIAATFFQLDGSTQIALVSVDTGSVRRLKTFDWRMPGRMKFSPDGRYLVYDVQLREDSQRHDIFLIATDGSREMPLVQHQADDTVLGWIPQSDRLLFASDRTGTIDAWTVHVALGPGGPKVVGSAELVKRDLGAISPMGFTRTRAFYYGVSTGMQDVCTVDFDPAAVKVIDKPTCVSEHAVGANYEPFWSPDGRLLAYVSERERLASNAGLAYGRPIIAVNALDGAGSRELAPKLTMIRRPRWSPDGRLILVRAYDINRRGGLFSVDVGSGEVSSIVRNGHDPVWLPDGTAIVYRAGESNNPSEVSVRIRSLGTGEEREIHHGPAQNLTLSPDGRLLAFVAPRAGGGTAINVMPFSGGPVRELHGDVAWQDPGDSSVFLTWLPDSRHLLFTRGDALWSLPVEGGPPRSLGLSMKGRPAIQLRPDGKRLAFTAGEAGRYEVWVMENFLPAPSPPTGGRRGKLR
jgi:Tol biopolymer transport system component